MIKWWENLIVVSHSKEIWSPLGALWWRLTFINPKIISHGCLKQTFIDLLTKTQYFTVNKVGKTIKMSGNIVLSSFDIQSWNLIHFCCKISEFKPIYWYFLSIYICAKMRALNKIQIIDHDWLSIMLYDSSWKW